jgi:hypothetical protein
MMALPKRRAPQSDDFPQAGQSPTEADWHALYEIENPAEVDIYVAEHPPVATILAEAPAEIAGAFDEEPHLLLRHEIDPEDQPATAYLVVDIVTKRDAHDAHERLTRFDDRWWIDALPQVARAGAVVVFYPRFA